MYFFVYMLIIALKVNGDPQPHWRPYTIGSGVGNRERLSVDVKTTVITKQDAEWLICLNSASLIGINKNRIFLQGSNQSEQELNGSITSTTVFGNRVLVATRNAKHSIITAYQVEQDGLTKLWNEDLEILVDHLAASKTFLIVIGGEKLEIYRETDFWMTGTAHLTENARDSKIIQHKNFQILAIAQENQISVYRIENDGGELKRMTDIAITDSTSLELFQLGMNIFLTVNGPYASLWKFESNAFRLASNFENIDAFLAVPLNTYRHDVLLFAQNRQSIFVFEPNGYAQLQLMGNMNALSRDSENYNVKDVILSKAVASLDSLLLPLQTGDAVLLSLTPVLEDVSDQAEIIFSELQELKQYLTGLFQLQNKEADQMMLESTHAINLNENNTIQSDWIVKDMEINNGEFSEHANGEFQVENLIFAGRNDWTEEDSQINVKVLKENAEELLIDVNDVNSDLQAETFNINNDVLENLPPVIDSGLTVNGRVEVNKLRVGKINGIDANEWLTDCFRLDQSNPIYGTKTAPSIEAASIETDNIGGIAASDLIFFDRNDVIVINGDLVFESDVGISNDIVLPATGSVNGFDLINDLLLVDYPFKGHVEFDSVAADSARIVEVTTANDSLIIPAHLSLNDIEPENFKRIQIDNIIVENELNAVEINNIRLNDILPSEFNPNLSTKSLNVRYINGKKFPQDFVTTADDTFKQFGGPKNFNSLSVGNLQTSMENFANLLGLPFERSASSSKPLVYVFNDIELLQPLKATLINNQNLSKITHQRCRQAKLSNSIEEYDFENIKTELLQVHGSLTTANGEVSGYQIHNYNNYLSKSKDEKIPSRLVKNVKNILTENQSKKIHTLRELNVTGKISVKDFVFLNEINAGNVTVNGLVSHVDLKNLYNDAVLKSDESVTISGRKEFQKIIANNVDVFVLNDWRLDEIATGQGDHAFRGPVILKGRTHIRSNLNALSHFNGINLTDLSERVSTKFEAFLVPGNFTLAPHAHVKTLSVDGSIQGKNLTQFLNQTIMRKQEMQLDGHFKFNHVIIDGNFVIDRMLNKLNITDLFADIVLLNRSAVVQALVLETGGVFSKLVVQNELTVPLVDGFDVNRWKEDAVILDQDTFVPVSVQIRNLSAQGNALVGFLNKRQLSLIPLKSAQVLPVKLIFEDIVATNNVQVTHLVNNVHLPDLWEQSMRHNASQTITGEKTFKSLSVDGSIYTQKINNQSISDFVTTYTAQTISTNLNFNKTTVTNITAAILFPDIQAWEKTTMLTTSNQTLNTSWEVIGDMSAGTIEAGLVLNRDLRNISERLNRKIHQAELNNMDIRKNYQQNCESVMALAGKTENQLRVLDMFDDIQGIEFTNEIHSTIFYKSEQSYFLLLTFTARCAAVLYLWNEPDAKFVKKSRFRIGTVDSWAILNHKFLIMSGTPCDKTLPPEGTIWEAKNSELTQITKLGAFSDVIVDKFTENVFHTISMNGSVSTWIFTNQTVQLQKSRHMGGKLKFISLDVGLGLSVWNGNEIISVENLTASRLPGDFVAVATSSPLVAMSDGLGVVEIFRKPLKDNLIDSLHFMQPTDLCWVDLKSPGELYLVFASDHHKIHVFQYKGVAGLLKRSTLPYPSSKLSLMDLPNGHTTPTPHLLIVHHKALRVLQVRMFGRPGLRLNTEC